MENIIAVKAVQNYSNVFRSDRVMDYEHQCYRPHLQLNEA